MKINFKKFEMNYYNDICNFLVEISKNNHMHINWNWARWEWMFFHPEFNRDLIDKIGLWFLDEKLIALATYDYYLEEGFFATKEGFDELQKEVLEYAINNFSDENGFGIAVNDKTDYVYVEPVCTIPEYRNKGIARMILMEALKRAYSLGAKKAYVISDSDFYKSLGFKQHSHYTFYWHNR